MGCEHLIIHQP